MKISAITGNTKFLPVSFMEENPGVMQITLTDETGHSEVFYSNVFLK